MEGHLHISLAAAAESMLAIITPAPIMIIRYFPVIHVQKRIYLFAFS